MDIYAAIQSILDTHYPHIPAWERVVYAGRIPHYWRFGNMGHASSLWYIVKLAQDGKLTAFDDVFNDTLRWYWQRIEQGLRTPFAPDTAKFYGMEQG